MRTVFVFATVALLVLAGCAKKGSGAAKAFGDAVGPAVEGGIQEVGKTKRELETVNESFDRAQSDVRLLKVTESPEARAFLAEHQKLLKHQEQLIKEEFAAVVKVLEDPRLSANDRRKRILPIANYIRTMDQGSSDDIRKARAAFARAHGFQLK